MNQFSAVIVTTEKPSHFLKTILFYTAIEWMADTLKDAGIEEVAVTASRASSQGENYILMDDSIKSTYDTLSFMKKEFIKNGGSVLILSSAQPALKKSTLETMMESHASLGGATFLCGADLICTGAIFDCDILEQVLSQTAGAVTLSDMEKLLVDAGFKSRRLTAPDFEETLSPEGAREIDILSKYIRRTINYRHMDSGVTIHDPDTTYIMPEVRIGKGAVILPGTILKGKTVIGENAVIGPNALLENAEVGEGTSVNASQIYESSVGSQTKVGPFAYIRPNCTVGDHVRIGDFVELKNSKIGDGTKVSHLTYIGDSIVGKNVNFGCGTVTVNFDGNGKYTTTIGDDVFIGCNTNLIAPVTVNRGAYTAAGSTVTMDVPEGALLIARARETIKEGWVEKHAKKKGAGK